MDRISAHLDRGWDLLLKGDLRGAKASARRVLELEADSADALNLLGQVAAHEGDVDEALERYRQAMALDDGYIDPMLNAAEVLLYPLQEFEEAIGLCDEVLEFVEEDDERTEALLLKFDAMHARGDAPPELRAVLDALPAGPFENPHQSFLAARAWFEVGEVERADALLHEALKREPNHPDAQYYLGLVRDAQGDWRGATLAFLEARELDLHSPQPQWTPPKEQFHRAVEKALGALEPEMATRLEGALVLVVEAPGTEIVADGVDPRAPVLIEGLLDVDQGEGPREPRRFVRVFVYQRNIERMMAGIEQLEDVIAEEVTEEIRHQLGIAPAPDGREKPRPGATPPEREAPTEVAPAPAAPEAEPVPGRSRKKPRKKD